MPNLLEDRLSSSAKTQIKVETKPSQQLQLLLTARNSPAVLPSLAPLQGVAMKRGSRIKGDKPQMTEDGIIIRGNSHALLPRQINSYRCNTHILKSKSFLV